MSHPEVIIAAVAARDQVKASAYARKHDIPTVHTSYQALLDDSSIDAVYIPLPNGLHFEWALKSLQAGKHVLLEKPSTSNAIEAEHLFRSDLFRSEHTNDENSPSPVLLEAFHSMFHPAFQKFLGLIEPANVVEGHASLEMIKGFLKEGDIRLNYDLSGGSLMDCGFYPVGAIRQIFQEEPVECIEVCSCSLISLLRAYFGYLIYVNVNDRLHHTSQPAWTRGLIRPSKLSGNFPTADMDRSQQIWP